MVATIKQPAISLPGHRHYDATGSVHARTLKCTCGWQTTRPNDANLVDDWHAHLDDVIRRAGREP